MSEVIEEMGIDGLQIVQDTDLYRFTSDSVLLSRFAQAKNGDRIADFCAGSGIVAFHFHALNRHKKKNLSYVLFELQQSLCELSKKTAELNGFEEFDFCLGRLQEIPECYRESFSLVLCNPPYERGGFENDCYEKAICRKELTITLEEIAKAASFALKFGGRFALINRADRLAEACYVLKKYNLEVKRIQCVAGKVGAKPYLVMLEAVKGGKPTSEILPVLINQKE